MRFLLLDDHRLVAQAVASLLSELCGLELIGICQSVAEAEPLLQHESLDLLILDVMLPGESWEQAARLFLRSNPHGAIVFLTAMGATFEPPAWLHASVLAVVDKADPLHELMAVVNRWLPRCGAVAPSAFVPSEALRSLTPREQRLLEALGRGLINREIAVELGLTVSTVETYRKLIACKLGISGRDLARLAVLQRLNPEVITAAGAS